MKRTISLVLCLTLILGLLTGVAAGANDAALYETYANSTASERLADPEGGPYEVSYVYGEEKTIYLHSASGITEDVTVALNAGSGVFTSQREDQNTWSIKLGAGVTEQPVVKIVCGTQDWYVRFREVDNDTLRGYWGEDHMSLKGVSIPGGMGTELRYQSGEKWVNIPETANVYLAVKNSNDELIETDLLGTIERGQNGKWNWQLDKACPNTIGYIVAEISGANGSSQMVSCLVSTGAAYYGLYDGDSYLPMDENYTISYNCAGKTSVNLSFKAQEQYDIKKLESDNPLVYVNGNTISVNPADVVGTVQAEIKVVMDDTVDDRGEYSYFFNINFNNVIKEPTDLVTTIPENVGYTDPEVRSYTAQVPGGYYLGIGDVTEDIMMHMVGPTTSFGMANFWGQAAAFFYTIDETGNQIPVKDQTVVGATDVTLDIYALTKETMPESVQHWSVSSKMPRILAGVTATPSAAPLTASYIYEFTAETEGAYLLVASAEVDGKTYYSYTQYYCYNISGEDKEYIYVRDLMEAYSINNPLEAAQEFLNGHDEMYLEKMLTLYFDGIEELRGTLVVPQKLMHVTLQANPQKENGDSGTVFYGGVQSDAAGVSVMGFDFIGPGQDQEVWGDYAADKFGMTAQTPNYALYGKNTPAFHSCFFSGYDQAVRVGPDCDNINVQGSFSNFFNNKTAIYVEYTKSAGGMLDQKDLTFIQNGCALHLEKVTGSIGLDVFQLENSRFVNNTVDVRNYTGRTFWLPMCYFWHKTGDNAFGPVGPNTPNESSNRWQPVTEPAPQNWKTVPAVIASPLAVAPNCNPEAGYFYAKQTYMSPAMQRQYPLGEVTAGQTIYGVDGKMESVIAGVTLTQEDASVEPTAAQAQTYSLRRLNGTARNTFNPTMGRDDLEDKIILAISSIPDGFDAEIAVPCANSWENAAVYFGETLLESSFADGVVTFDAVEGTTGYVEYQIIRTEAPADDTPVIVPDVPAKKEETEDKPDAAEVFDDVSEDDWFCEAVSYVTDSGLMKGVGEGEFAPEARFSRAMMWTMLARLSGVDTEGGENWYDKGLAWAKANGVSDGSAPDGSITREQLVTMLWRFEGEPKADLKVLDGYADGDKISDYAREAMAWAVEQGVISGRGNGVLAPQGTATRAEVAQIFYNYLAKLTAAGGKRDAL